jgi:hypothetical protein
MSDAAPNNASSLEARIIGERVQGAPAFGHAQKLAELTMLPRPPPPRPVRQKKVLGEAAQQAWSQAGGVAEDVVDAGRRATKSVSRQIERPLMVGLVGFALGYLASLWIHKEGGRSARIADEKGEHQRAFSIGDEGNNRPT